MIALKLGFECCRKEAETPHLVLSVSGDWRFPGPPWRTAFLEHVSKLHGAIELDTYQDSET